MNFIDTHFHLDLWNDPKQLIDEIERNKIYTIAVTNTPSVFDYSYNLCRDKKYVRAALGLHPELAHERVVELELFKEKMRLTKYIGEIGLDFSSRNLKDKEVQLNVFKQIISECASAKDKIITIHSRKAEKEVIDIIGSNFSGKIILHWYSGSLKELRRAVDLGFYFSINNQMLKSKSGRSIIQAIPIERILTETDGPFTYYRDEKQSPLFTRNTVEELGLLLSLSAENMKSKIFLNFKKVLGVNRT